MPLLLHQAAPHLPETANGGLGGAGLLALGPGTAHLQQRNAVGRRRRATLDEVADATIFHRNEAGRPGKVELLQPAPPQRRRIVGIAEIDPVEVGAIDAAREELT